MCEYCHLGLGHFGGRPNAEKVIGTIGECSLCGKPITTEYSEEYLKIEDRDFLMCEKCLDEFTCSTDD